MRPLLAHIGPSRADTTGAVPAAESDTAQPEVISRAQAGDTAAVAELYDRYVDLVYALSFSSCCRVAS